MSDPFQKIIDDALAKFPEPEPLVDPKVMSEALRKLLDEVLVKSPYEPFGDNTPSRIWYDYFSPLKKGDSFSILSTVTC